MSGPDVPDAPSLGAVLSYTRWAVRRSRLPEGARSVALLVATYYNRRDGYARPSWDEIAAVLGISRSAVWRRVRACTEAGIWHADARPPAATRYRYPLAGAVHNGRASATVALSTTVAPARLDGRGSATVTVAVARPELSTEHELENVLPPSPVGDTEPAGPTPPPEWIREAIRAGGMRR